MLCAVCEDMHDDVIITADCMDKLNEMLTIACNVVKKRRQGIQYSDKVSDVEDDVKVDDVVPVENSSITVNPKN